jgi:hypothetical protein
MSSDRRVDTPVPPDVANAQNRVFPSEAQQTLAPELAAADTPAGHIRNALTILTVCAINPNAAYKLYDSGDIAGVEMRLYAALEELEPKSVVRVPVQTWELTPAGRNALEGKTDARASIEAASAKLMTRLGLASAMVLAVCGPLTAPPAKRCPARDTIVLGKPLDSIRVVRGCP